MVCKTPVPALLTLLSHPQVEMSVLPHGAESVTCQADLLLILPMSLDEVSWSSLHFQDRVLWPFFPLLSRASGPVIVSIKVLSRCSSGPPRASCIPPRTLPNFALCTECGADGPPAVCRVVSVSVTTLAKKHRGQRIIHRWKFTKACRVIGLSY